MMNKLRTNKKLLAGMLAVFIAAPSFAGIPTKEKITDDEATINYEQLDPFFAKDNKLQAVTFKIYDLNDNLRYEKTLAVGQSPDTELVKLLNKSDYLAESGTVSYYRLNE